MPTECVELMDARRLERLATQVFDGDAGKLRACLAWAEGALPSPAVMKMTYTLVTGRWHACLSMVKALARAHDAARTGGDWETAIDDGGVGWLLADVWPGTTRQRTSTPGDVARQSQGCGKAAERQRDEQ